MTDKKILIIAPYQFGELSDCYYWAKYATLEGYKVSYIGYRYKYRQLKERTYDGVKVIGVPHVSNKALLGVLFFATIIWTTFMHSYRNVIICRFPHCEILAKLFPKRNVILDVRTLSVDPDVNVRNSENEKLQRMKGCFKTCSVISKGVGERIGGPYELLPLGAESISLKEKDFNELRLFYIGGFTGRNLHIFLEGLGMYKQRYGQEFPFDIVGGGTPELEKQLRDTVTTEHLEKVQFHGYLNHDEAQDFFDGCNVGVCFVPVTDYYQYQPPTKLYEYLLSGMVSISTDTYSNKEAMTPDNGIVIHDTKEDVCEGLHQLYQRRLSFHSSIIVKESQSFHWKNIIKTYFVSLFTR